MSLTTLVPPFVLGLIAILAVTFLPRREGHATAIVTMLAVAAVSLLAHHGTYFETTLFGIFDAVLFQVDEFTALMGLVFGIIGAGAVLYAYSSEMSKTATAFALSYVAAALGAVFAGDWLTLIFFWELMAVTSTLLVWHYGGDAVRSGFRYAIFHGIGGSLLLLAVIWHYASTGTMLYADSGIAAGIPALLAAIGIGVNCGFVGLHQWLPDTYPSPHIAASVFLCVFTTKTGVYAMYRAFPEGHLWIAYMGGAMAVFGAFAALLQHDMRRLLSYHIQSQVGYMIAGIGIGTALAAAGAFGHVFNHILYKGLLFMAVGVIIYRTGKHDLYEIGTLWKAMPLTLVAFTIGALSITGVPGFNGFISKGIVINAAHKKHLDVLYWLLMVGAVGTFLSFLKLGYYAFFNGETAEQVKDAKRGQTVAMLVVGGLCVLFGIWWTGLVDLLPHVPHDAHLHPYSLKHIGEVLALGIGSAVGFAVIRKPLSRLHVPDTNRILFRELFYLSKYVVYTVTEAFKIVDRAGVTLVQELYWIGAHPVEAVTLVTERLPDRLVLVQVEDKYASRLYLRAGIGTSILILIAVLTAVIFFIL